MAIFLKIRCYKCCITIELIPAKELILLNVIKIKNATIGQYWCFNPGFKLQHLICNDCYDLTMSCLTVTNIAIITVKIVDYRFVIHNISKYEAINLLKKSWVWNSWVYIKYIALIFSLLIAVFLFFCFVINEMVDSEYSTGNYKSSKMSWKIQKS